MHALRFASAGGLALRARMGDCGPPYGTPLGINEEDSA